MNKKIILGVTVAGILALTGIALPKSYAATEESKTINSGIFYNNGSWEVNIALPKKSSMADQSTSTLNKEKLTQVFKDLYNQSITITVTGDTVGTGSKVTMPASRQVGVVLYGDANGNGKVDSADALRILRYDAGNKGLILDGSANFKAAEVSNKDKKNEINTADALRILRYDAAQVDMLDNKIQSGVQILNPAKTFSNLDMSLTLLSNELENKNLYNVLTYFDITSEEEKIYIKDAKESKINDNDTVEGLINHIEAVADSYNTTIANKLLTEIESQSIEEISLKATSNHVITYNNKSVTYKDRDEEYTVEVSNCEQVQKYFRAFCNRLNTFFNGTKLKELLYDTEGATDFATLTVKYKEGVKDSTNGTNVETYTIYIGEKTR